MKNHLLTWVLEGLLSWNLRRKMQWIGQSHCPPCIRTWKNSGFCKQFCIENSQQNIDSEAKPIQDSLLGHPCKCRVRCDCWPGNTLVTGNSPWSPGSPVFHFHLQLLLLFLPEPLPETPSWTPRTCLLTLKTQFGLFSSFQPGSYHFILQLRVLLKRQTSTAMMEVLPEAPEARTNLPGSHLPARRTRDHIIVLNRREMIQGLRLGASSMPQLIMKSSFSLPDPNKGQGYSLAREKNCRRKVSAWTSLLGSL